MSRLKTASRKERLTAHIIDLLLIVILVPIFLVVKKLAMTLSLSLFSLSVQ